MRRKGKAIGFKRINKSTFEVRKTKKEIILYAEPYCSVEEFLDEFPFQKDK